MNFPKIDALKEYGTHFNANQFISLDPSSDFGNLNLSWLAIVVRLECVNNLIFELYHDYENRTSIMNLDQHHKNQFITEQIFYWLKKTADELFSMIDILSYYKKNRKYPKKIKISSIGNFIKAENPFNGEFNKFKNHLVQLNEIANGYKHSFINSQIHAHSAIETPLVFAYTLKYNDRGNKAKFYSIKTEEILNRFNKFITFSKGYIVRNFVDQS